MSNMPDPESPYILAQDFRDAGTAAQFNPGVPPITVAHSMGGMRALLAGWEETGQPVSSAPSG